MIKALIVDDEADARALMANLLQRYFPQIEVLGFAGNKREAVDKITVLQPDLIFLDINLGDGTGFDVLDHFQNKSNLQCIFTTAFDEFAIRAFRYNAIDYHLKPIAINEFKSAVNKALSANFSSDMVSKMDSLMDQIRTKNLNRMTINTHDGLAFVKLTDIVRIEADGNYSTIFLQSKEKS